MQRVKLNLRYWLALVGLVVFLVFHFAPLPAALHQQPLAKVLLASDGALLAARIAEDQQWRFPPSHTLPKKYIQALTAFEDRYFFSHPGVNPVSIMRAFVSNIKAGHVVSGGSTITMQLARMLRDDPPRTYGNKLLEIFLALKLEWHFSKEEILSFYASRAPFGGNTVGLRAASWRYFARYLYEQETDKTISQLSWAEAAFLAVLPNSPALVHPGRSRTTLLAKRNRLLSYLHQQNILNDHEYQLSLLEPLPFAPQAVPQVALHLLQTLIERHPEQTTFHSTLNAALQQKALQAGQFRGSQLSNKGVHNLSLVVIDHSNMTTPIYIGNITSAKQQDDYGKDIDIAIKPRSTGSILKPLLYGLMLQAGELLPETLVADVPTNFRGFTPENYDNNYRGAVPAKEALSRSLNIPAVRMLKHYGVQRFYDDLKRMGLSTLFRSSEDYGLSLILGGAEGNLWELTGVFAELVDTAQHGQASHFRSPSLLKNNSIRDKHARVIEQGAAWLTLEALLEVIRPGNEGLWREFSSSQQIAWKTGTSYGLRDAWAIGSNGKYTVGVWAGNASGEGIPELSGLNSAAPLMFDIFDLLGNSLWIGKPVLAIKELQTCKNDGYLSAGRCEAHTSLAPINSHFQKISPYHQTIQLDKTGQFRVHGGCETIANIQVRPWFILPPIQEYYWRQFHKEYAALPPWREDCIAELANYSNDMPMDIIYPLEGSRVYIPIELDGQQGRVIFRASHRNTRSTIYWHIDERFVQHTDLFHDIAVYISPGWHKLILVDELGFRLERWFKVLDKNKNATLAAIQSDTQQ